MRLKRPLLGLFFRARRAFPLAFLILRWLGPAAALAGATLKFELVLCVGLVVMVAYSLIELYGGAVLRMRFESRLRRGQIPCPACSSSLQGLLTSTCPICGNDLDAAYLSLAAAGYLLEAKAFYTGFCGETPAALKPAFRRTCLQCGYDLRGLSSERCPECGRPFDASVPETFGPQETASFWYNRNLDLPETLYLGLVTGGMPPFLVMASGVGAASSASASPAMTAIVLLGAFAVALVLAVPWVRSLADVMICGAPAILLAVLEAAAGNRDLLGFAEFVAPVFGAAVAVMIVKCELPWASRRMARKEYAW